MATGEVVIRYRAVGFAPWRIFPFIAAACLRLPYHLHPKP
jgi:hypothetical protein